MSGEDKTSPPADSAERLAQIEARLPRLEEQLGLRRDQRPEIIAEFPSEIQSGNSPSEASNDSEIQLEYALGQKWFAHVGILVLAIGAAFTLSLPYPALPSSLPSILGYILVAGLFLLARLWRQSFDLVSRYLRAAAMALLFFATLRLYFFSPSPALTTTTIPGKMAMLTAAALNLAIALWRQSTYLIMLGLSMAYLTIGLLNSVWILFPALLLLSALVVGVWVRHRWPVLLLFGIFATYLTYALWVIHRWQGQDFRLLTDPPAMVVYILLLGMVLASPPFFNRDQEEKDPFLVVSALLNAGLCYGLFTIHSLVALSANLGLAHLIASGVFLGQAALLWVVRRSQLVCFFYAIIGYLALSICLLKAFAMPNVFVWLSVQSAVVVTTALWFRSRLIVMANFFIYLMVVAGYLAVARHENGISLGFGLVAIYSARLLNWKKERLHLRTEMMRNAYLVCVFAVFPYALYFLTPRAYIAVSWIGLGGIYYLLSFILHNQKYRWMGHFTLVLTIFYVLIVGIVQLKPGQRIFSFFALGTVLVAVSMTFSRYRERFKIKGRN